MNLNSAPVLLRLRIILAVIAGLGAGAWYLVQSTLIRGNEEITTQMVLTTIRDILTVFATGLLVAAVAALWRIGRPGLMGRVILLIPAVMVLAFLPSALQSVVTYIVDGAGAMALLFVAGLIQSVILVLLIVLPGSFGRRGRERIAPAFRGVAGDAGWLRCLGGAPLAAFILGFVIGFPPLLVVDALVDSPMLERASDAGDDNLTLFMALTMGILIALTMGMIASFGGMLAALLRMSGWDPRVAGLWGGVLFFVLWFFPLRLIGSMAIPGAFGTTLQLMIPLTVIPAVAVVMICGKGPAPLQPGDPRGPHDAQNPGPYDGGYMSQGFPLGGGFRGAGFPSRGMRGRGMPGRGFPGSGMPGGISGHGMPGSPPTEPGPRY